MLIESVWYCCYFSRQTHFVRHNTPHPKELKARHNKFIGKDKNVDGHVIKHDPNKKPQVRAPAA